MRIDGIEVKKRNDLGYRPGNPEIDENLEGEPVKPNYVSFVRIKDCKVYEEDNRWYYEPKDAPCIPVSHGGTYYGYGKTNIRSSKLGIWINGELHYNYQQVTVYFARKGYVYTGTIQKKINAQTFKSIFIDANGAEIDARRQFDKLMKCPFQLTEECVEYAVTFDKYDWFEPYMKDRTLEEKTVYEGQKLNNLIKNEHLTQEF